MAIAFGAPISNAASDKATAGNRCQRPRPQQIVSLRTLPIHDLARALAAVGYACSDH